MRPGSAPVCPSIGVSWHLPLAAITQSNLSVGAAVHLAPVPRLLRSSEEYRTPPGA